MGDKAPRNKGFFSFILYTIYQVVRIYGIGFSWLGQQTFSKHKKMKGYILLKIFNYIQIDQFDFFQ